MPSTSSWCMWVPSRLPSAVVRLRLLASSSETPEPGLGANDSAKVLAYSGFVFWLNKSPDGTAFSSSGGASGCLITPLFHSGNGGSVVVENRRSRYSSNSSFTYSGL